MTAAKLNWSTIDDIAYALWEKFPETDPTNIRFTEKAAAVVSTAFSLSASAAFFAGRSLFCLATGAARRS